MEDLLPLGMLILTMGQVVWALLAQRFSDCEAERRNFRWYLLGVAGYVLVILAYLWHGAGELLLLFVAHFFLCPIGLALWHLHIALEARHLRNVPAIFARLLEGRDPAAPEPENL